MTNAFTGKESPRGKVFRRAAIVEMLQAALGSGDYRFARQAALAWLAAFPGDLEVMLFQAQAVIAEGRPAQVIQALELITRKDPFYLEAYRALAWASRNIDEARFLGARTAAYVLGERIPEGTELEDWGKPLRVALGLYEAKQYAQAGHVTGEILRLEPDLLLAQAMQLLIARATGPASEVLPLAQALQERWPDCLLAGLVLAESFLQHGSEPEAVRLLHLGAAGDSMGQVAGRLWGANHPYRSLWPDDMVIYFDQPIPAGVAGQMGWNRLSPGEIRAVEPQAVEQPSGAAKNAPEQTQPAAVAVERAPVEEPDPTQAAPEPVQPGTGPVVQVECAARVEPQAEATPAEETPVPAAETAGATGADAAASPQESNPAGETASAETGEPAAPARPPVDADTAAVAKTVETELEKLSRKLRQPTLARADGRFPIYVIFTSKSGLTEQYGPQTASVMDSELRRLAAAVGKRQGWQAMVFYPDDPACAGQYGLLPADPRDPWKLKHALVDLDAALGKRGEMIGAVLIVGGDSVVPFHRLPNPADDSDLEVVSDSPYATVDANYFVPEWPVGRLPGESGPDAGTLLEQIRQVYRFHNHHAKGKLAFGREWMLWIMTRLETLVPFRKTTSFGYTAAVWRRSSLAVFRPIGAPHTVVASPPAFSGALKRKATANLGYYNLHGLEDSPSWYGQRDPAEVGAVPDYPVALSPADLHRNGQSPRFIFSEACYGGHISGKTEKDSLALKFLSLGTLGVVASTGIAYGSISTPLIAADLLGQFFWRQIRYGRTVGDALVQAKIDLVREMNRRQGYLDDEDQKTLISFLLYGDPLASYDGFRAHVKSVPRSKDHPWVRMTSEADEEVLLPSKVPDEVLKGVKQVVAEYLPGADVAGIQFCRLQVNGNGKDTQGVGKALLGKKNGKDHPGRLVVTVSKKVQVAQHVHRHFLRVTMDENGNTIKLALSR